MQDLGQKAPFGEAKTADDAEVDGDDLAVVIDEKIALVHVGVEKAIPHGMAQE